MGHSNAYLLTAGGSAVLVDTGCPGKINKLESALRENGLDFPDLGLVILTHTHYDHAGCLAEIKERSGAKVLVHEAEAGCLEKGYTPFPKGTMWFSRIISGLANSLFAFRAKYVPVKPDIVINKEYDLGYYLPGTKARVIPTPGHTEGSVSVVLGNEEVVVGDTLFNDFPKTVFPPFANDEKQLFRSWEKLAETSCATFYPGHGGALSIEKLADSYRKLSKRV
ncbi:MBL fold metallo-hydrolase [Methanosarcina sp. KYL-1]|nr:MBL fold metallo-hydrolase [Methanosarcina sp. KYL-1]